jgi:hypothetical protein
MAVSRLEPREKNGGNKFCTECKLRHMAVSRLEPREKNGGNFEKKNI